MLTRAGSSERFVDISLHCCSPSLARFGFPPLLYLTQNCRRGERGGWSSNSPLVTQMRWDSFPRGSLWPTLTRVKRDWCSWIKSWFSSTRSAVRASWSACMCPTTTRTRAPPPSASPSSMCTAFTESSQGEYFLHPFHCHKDQVKIERDQYGFEQLTWSSVWETFTLQDLWCSLGPVTPPWRGEQLKVVSAKSSGRNLVWQNKSFKTGDKAAKNLVSESDTWTWSGWGEFFGSGSDSHDMRKSCLEIRC